MMNELEKENQKEIEPMITFLKETREGKYAKVDETSLEYSRINEETIIISEEYYFGIR